MSFTNLDISEAAIFPCEESIQQKDSKENPENGKGKNNMEYKFICKCGYTWKEEILGDDMLEIREGGGFMIREGNNFKRFIICKDCRNFSSILINE